MGLTPLSAVTAFTIGGNDDSTNAVTSVMTIRYRTILKNNLDMLALRADAIARVGAEAGPHGWLIMKKAVRLMMGTNYDMDKGSSLQRTSLLTTTIKIDQIMATGIIWEDFDIERFMDMDDAGERTAVVGEVLDSVVYSILLSYEAFYIRGITSYATAMYNKYPEMIKKVPTIKSSADAIALFDQLKTTANNWRRQFTPSEMGINSQEILLVLDITLYKDLTLYLQNVILNIGDDVKMLLTGELPENKIQGLNFREHTMLGSKYLNADGSAINKDHDFDFSNYGYLMIMNDATAMPVGMEKTINLIDNDTANMKTLFKYMGSLPEVYRNYIQVGVYELPTQDEVVAAQALEYDGKDKFYNKHFQLADWEKGYGSAPTNAIQSVAYDGKLSVTITLDSTIANFKADMVTLNNEVRVVDAKINGTTIVATIDQVLAPAVDTTYVVNVVGTLMDGTKNTFVVKAAK